MMRHVSTVHEKIKNYRCDKCNRSFAENGNLKAHIITVHDKEKRFGCDFCGERFLQRRTMKNHVISKHGTKQSKASKVDLNCVI